MNIFRTLSSIALLSLPVVPTQMALSQPATPEASAQSDHFKAAYQMASLSVGGVALSPAVQKVMHHQLLQGFAQDGSFQELENQYPGLTLAIVDAVLPIAVRQSEQNTPALIERLAALYAAEMTANEIAVATEWFASPAFSRLNTSMESNMDLSKIIEKAINETESQISSDELDSIRQNSAAMAASAMELEDQAVLMQFSRTPAFAKFESLKPRSTAIETAWTNEQVADQDAEIENITIKTIEEFTGLDLSE
ncbi:hypothetical protein [Parasphingorhabdus sp.]|uniref:hypothetical protein n=1 Tax=Parasphingorhabdus sp. TaxID=2709688 RepID=UPI003593ADF2